MSSAVAYLSIFLSAIVGVYTSANYGIVAAIIAVVLVQVLGSLLQSVMTPPLKEAPSLDQLGLEMISGTIPKKGKPMFVEIWATWCPPCVKSIPHLNELFKTYGDRVSFLAISPEKLEVVKKFVENRGNSMTYPVACSSQAPAQFNIVGFPTSFVIADDCKTVLWSGHPSSPDLEETIRAVLASKE